jgi:hypothetical protein
MAELKDVNALLLHQRAELGAAEAFRGGSLFLQFTVALLAAYSVFEDDAVHLLTIAGLGALAITVWLVLDLFYRQHRGSGDQARRLLLVVHGFGEEVGERGIMQAKFTAAIDGLPELSIEEYFATVAAAGPVRAAEMIDESAFFTGALQQSSGRSMLLILLFLVVIVGVLGLLFAPQLDGAARVTIARVLLAFAVFLLSSDVLGAALAHQRAANSIEAIRYRLSAARGRGYPIGDVLQAMADYNAAVEGAPLPLPGTYKRHQSRLNRQWADYKARTGIGRSV